MSRTNQITTTDRIVILIAFICLLLTTFPLAQGWISRGDFIPRLFFLVVVLFLKPQLFLTKDLFWLALYFFFLFISGGNKSIIGLAANLMEFAVAVVIANYILNDTGLRSVSIMAWFALIATVIIMLMTIIVDTSRPGIVREMVRFSYDNEFDLSRQYVRMGVCGYAFAQISMCLAPVFLFLFRNEKHKVLFLGCFVLCCYFVYISGITTCLILLVFLVFLLLGTIRATKVSSLLPAILIIGVILYVFGLLIIELVIPHLEGTTFYGHLAGVLEFYGKDTRALDTYDVENRVDFYKESLATFLSHPIIGNAAGKIGGHNFFLDRLAQLGIVGTTPLFVFLYLRFKAAMNYIPRQSQIVYAICIIGFFILGFLKNLSGIDYWTYLFIYIPCLLKVFVFEGK